MKNEEHIAYPYRRIMYKMQLILMTGELLMASGAATERIMRDMLRAATYMDITPDKISIHVNYTTLMLNINDDDHSYTEFRKCKEHGVNMEALDAVSNLTWTAIRENYPLENTRRNFIASKRCQALTRPSSAPSARGLPVAASASSSAATGFPSFARRSAPPSASPSAASAIPTVSTTTPALPSPLSPLPSLPASPSPSPARRLPPTR